MFLSNPRKTFLTVAVCVALLQACGGSQTQVNKNISLTDETTSEFPFSTKEPEVYQGDFVTTSGDVQEHYFFARKGVKWRYDFFRGADLSISQIWSEKMYVIDHEKKTYREITLQGPIESDTNDRTRYFFSGHEHHDFDEIGRDGTLIKYKVRDSGETKGVVIVTVDTASDVIVKHEFTSSNNHTPDFVYELKNLKMEVDDNIFTIPNGYLRVSADDGRLKRSTK